jgi:hypothetical protein
MALLPKISLTLGNKCNLVTLTEETGPYNAANNPGGWGGPNIDTSNINYAFVNVYPFTYTPTQNAASSGEITGTVFTDTLHLSGAFAVGQYLSGPGVVPGTIITALLTGTGTNNGGTYQINISQSVPASTTIIGTTPLNQYVLKDNIVDVYSLQINAPIPGSFIALADQTWNQSDGIYQVVYSIYDSRNLYQNDKTYELFICNICSCKDQLVVALIDACDSITVKKLKEQVDQMEIFIYGIKSAFACGDFDTATAIIEAAGKYCETIVGCRGCGCGGC